MTLDEFGTLLQSRIPTCDELISFVKQQQGWRIIVQESGAAALRVTHKDDLAVAVAKLISREPYRTNVLRSPDATRQPLLTAGEAKPKPENPYCPTCRAWVNPDYRREVGRICENDGMTEPAWRPVGEIRPVCPYRRLS